MIKDFLRFWSKVEKTDSCWNWKAYTDKDGYGTFWYKGTNVKAHRFSYEITNEKISNELVIDHLCKNTSCVNPSHLEIVTIKENTLRGISFSALNAKKTHCPKGHEYIENNTQLTNKGKSRKCRICSRKQWSMWYQRKKIRGSLIVT